MAAYTVLNSVKTRNLVSACIHFSTKCSSFPEFVNERRNLRNERRHYATDGKSPIYDVVVVGGGIVGMATATEILRQIPDLKLAVLEKEDRLAYHQTGHNSGVIHAGIYYKPDSLKARLCVKGLHMMYEYCNKNEIPYKKCGKLIVATNKMESERLDDLIERGTKNNVPDMKVVDAAGIKEIEPTCQGLRAIWSPHTGIVDYTKVTEQLGCEFKEGGGKIHLNFKVKCFLTNLDSESESERRKYPLKISSSNQCVKCSYAIVCAGLQSDKLAVMTGCKKEPKIVPVRGEYLQLAERKAKCLKSNIYPVPNPNYPFLGVHFTPRMNGNVWLGPNAILAFKREGYRWYDFNIIDFAEAISYPGFIKLVTKNPKYVMEEISKSIFLHKQVKELQKFIPNLTVKDVRRGPAGVRAQALDREGNLVEDFVFDLNKKTAVGKRVLHCRNAPSPAATASLAIAELIVRKANEEFALCEL